MLMPKAVIFVFYIPILTNWVSAVSVKRWLRNCDLKTCRSCLVSYTDAFRDCSDLLDTFFYITTDMILDLCHSWEIWIVHGWKFVEELLLCIWWHVSNFENNIQNMFFDMPFLDEKSQSSVFDFWSRPVKTWKRVNIL